MKITGKLIISTVVAALIGAFLGAYLIQKFLPPYPESKVAQVPPALSNEAIADNLRRDQIVADNLAGYDARAKKAACEGYLGGLKEQNLPISPIIAKACEQ